MNTSFFKSLKHLILGCILCFTFTVLFTSCENFLKANDIRGEIERAIAYNNAKKVPVLIRADEGTGSFLVEGEKEFTVNFTEAELQFTANKKAIVFTGLEAVSKINQSVSRNDCVEITLLSSNEETGIYKYNVKIIKYANDIQIKPTYILRPAIVSITPAYTDYPAEPITIQFNVPIEDIDVPSDECILNFNNITIKSNNTPINNCFRTPFLNEDKTILTIIPDSSKFNAFLSSHNSTLYTDITISFDSRTKFETDGKLITFSEEKPLDYTVHYCTEVEQIAPTKQAFYIYKQWNPESETGSQDINLKFDTVQEDYNIYSEDYYYTIDDSTLISNRTTDTIYIYGWYKDTGDSSVPFSGIHSIQVEEYWDGLINSGDRYEPKTINKEFTKDSEGVLLWYSYTNGETIFCIKEHLDFMDGFISITTTVRDGCGNCATPVEFTVLKTTCIDFGDIHLSNVYDTYSFFDDFDMESYLDSYRTVKLIYVPLYSYLNQYYGISASDYIPDDYIFMAQYASYRQMDPDIAFSKIQYQLYNNNHEPITEPEDMEFYDYHNGHKEWFFTIDNEIEDLFGLTVRIFLEDELGNSAYKDYNFPSNLVIVKEEETNGKHTISLTPIKQGYTKSGFIIFRNNSEDEWDYQSFYGGKIESNKIQNGAEYYILLIDEQIAGQLSKKYIAGCHTTSQLQNIEYEPISYQSDSGVYANPKTIVSIPIKNSSINYFDAIFASYCDINSNNLLSNVTFLQNGEKSIKLSFDTTLLFKNKYKIVVYGLKNDVCVESTPAIIEITDSKYDNVKPTCVINYSPRFPDCYYFKFDDKESGIDKIYFNNKLLEIPEISDSDTNTYVFYLNIDNEEITVQKIQANDIGKGTTLESVFVFYIRDVIDHSSEIPFIKYKLKIVDKAGNETIMNKNEKLTLSKPLKIIRTNDEEEPNCPYIFSSTDPKTYTYSCWYFNNSGWNYYWYTNNALKFSIKNNKDEHLYFVNNRFNRFYNSLSIPLYYYIGNDSNTGKYDYVHPINASTSAVEISSDAPVLVQTIVSPCSYQICKNWTKEEWLTFNKTVGDKVIVKTERFKETYEIPLNEIKKGECYVVIAHFADGTSAITDEVMIKY